MVLIGIDKITEEESYTMADEYRMALAELLRKAEMEGGLDFLREGVRVLGQALMELEVSQRIGAERHERTPERTGQRNGYRDRSWDTRVGTVELKVPRVRTRRLEGAYPYLWLDATYLKVRENSRVVSQAVVIAIGVKATGEREVLGLDVGPSEDGAFWTGFLRGLLSRKLSGVKLVVSDAHEGLKGAISAVLQGASWQRCRVHFMRNALALVPKAAAQMVAATIRTVFVQPDAASAHEQWRRVADSFRSRYPRLSGLLDDAEADVLAYLAFPREHWRQIWSNNPLERLNREIKRRTDVVGIFPNQGAVIRLVGSVLAEQHDEWQVSRRYLSAESLAKLYEETKPEMMPALLAAS